jgi:periplasmic protein TonB
MTATNHAGVTSSFPFLFNALPMGIIVSAIMHAAVMFLLFLVPVTSGIPQLQTIPIILERPDASSPDAPQGIRQTVASKVNQAQNKINMKSPLKPLPVQKAVFRESSVLEQQVKAQPVLSVQRPFPSESGNSMQATDSLNAENQGAARASTSVAAKTRERGIAETQFGETGAPAFIHREMPVYPILARILGKEGKIVLKLLIDKNGRLLEVEVVEAAGFGFTEAAVAAVKNSTYAPASHNGEKVTARALIPVRFRLQ